MDNSKCNDCKFIETCKWFVEILRHDESFNNSHKYEFQGITIIYDCTKYEKK